MQQPEWMTEEQYRDFIALKARWDEWFIKKRIEEEERLLREEQDRREGRPFDQEGPKGIEGPTGPQGPSLPPEERAQIMGAIDQFMKDQNAKTWKKWRREDRMVEIISWVCVIGASFIIGWLLYQWWQ